MTLPGAAPSRWCGYGYQRPARLLVVVLILATTLGCGALQTADRALTDFNGAIASLDQTAANASGVLQDLEKKLNADGQQFLSGVDNIAHSVLQQTNLALKCDTDFFRSRAQNDLKNIRFVNWLQQTKPPPIAPVACSSDPVSVDTGSLDSGTLKILTISGFDFNPKALDPRLPSFTAHADVVDRNRNVIGAMPVGLVWTQAYQTLVNLDPNSGYHLPANAAALLVSFPEAPNVPSFPIPVTHPTVPPPPATVTSMTAQFDTTDDDKPKEGIIDLTLATGAAIFHQPSTDDSWYFNDNTTHIENMTVRAGTTVANLQGQPWRVCISNGNSWHFNLLVHGVMSNHTEFLLAFTGLRLEPNSSQNCNPPNVMPNPIQVGQIPVVTPAPTPTLPAPPIGGCLLVVQAPSATALGGVTINPFLRPNLPPRC